MSLRRRSVTAWRQAVGRALDDLAPLRQRLRDDPADAKALHAFRKQARRLAAAAQGLECFLKPTAYARLAALTSDVPRGLGRCRDSDVLVARLARLRKGKAPATRARLDEVAESLRVGDRKARVKRALRRSSPGRLDRVRRLAAGARAANVDGLGLVEHRLRARLRPALRPGADVRDLHALRLDLKAYRYALEALHPTESANSSPDGQLGLEAARLSALLGRITDAEALRAEAHKARGTAARVVHAAADEDERQARQAFEDGWLRRRWPTLQSVLTPGDPVLAARVRRP